MSVEMFRKQPKKYEDAYASLLKAKVEKLARNMFKWTCHEGHVTSDMIERYLWLDGRALVFRHEMLGWIVTRCDETAWNVNGYATAWRPVMDFQVPGVTMPAEVTEADGAVCIYEWAERYIHRRDCLFLCEQIADVNETIRQQVWNQKTPLMAISGTTQQKDKLKNSLIKMAGNVSVLFVDSDISASVKPLDLNAPFNIVELTQHKQQIMNEIKDWLGVDYKDAVAKKERMIVDEQEANDEDINYTLADQLNERLKACDKLTEFGLAITCEVQRSVRPEDDSMDGDPEQPDDEVDHGAYSPV